MSEGVFSHVATERETIVKNPFIYLMSYQSMAAKTYNLTLIQSNNRINAFICKNKHQGIKLHDFNIA